MSISQKTKEMQEVKSNKNAPQILVIDDHQIVLTGIRYLLKSNLLSAHVDGILSVDSISKKLISKEYDLIILDINMPGADTHSLIHLIKSMQEETKILIFSMNSEELFAKRYLKLGVNGYLMKQSGEHELINAINKILEGRRYISPNLLEALSEDAFTGRSANIFDNLSPREFEVMKHLVKGLGVKEIAAITNLHHSTISTHKAKIFEKTSTHNILELKEMASFHNLL
jgi:two-component system, NarL family, invasion response regulator UvrY